MRVSTFDGRGEPQRDGEVVNEAWQVVHVRSRPLYTHVADAFSTSTASASGPTYLLLNAALPLLVSDAALFPILRQEQRQPPTGSRRRPPPTTPFSSSSSSTPSPSSPASTSSTFRINGGATGFSLVNIDEIELYKSLLSKADEEENKWWWRCC
ncbi:hypothetical protein QJS04_geneDACA011689 [Acorus gramineus]|uniref:Uncharacterized protein n=1 Tax=Acorus gramineus TaxID=55184 RepID=A0AAV9BID6_ACOGR|nr:hypothetical protein QJS04_geneDACA011689 [Acorus gramineus]